MNHVSLVAANLCDNQTAVLQGKRVEASNVYLQFHRGIATFGGQDASLGVASTFNLLPRQGAWLNFSLEDAVRRPDRKLPAT